MLIQKPKETTEWLNRFLIHPLSNKLVRYLVNTRVTPNHLSLLGLVYAIMGAYALYYAVDSKFCFILSLLFFFLRMICDASDGQLARAKKQSSEWGTIIDGIPYTNEF